MRRVVTGVDPQGSSTVLSDGSPPTAFHATPTSPPAKVTRIPDEGSVSPGEAIVHQLWRTDPETAPGGSDPTVVMDTPEFETPSGATSWIVTEMGPGLEVPKHSTATIDYGFVVRGDVQMGLDTGTITLRAGECVLVDGVTHSWTAGPDGCVIVTVQLGIPEGQH